MASEPDQRGDPDRVEQVREESTSLNETKRYSQGGRVTAQAPPSDCVIGAAGPAASMPAPRPPRRTAGRAARPSMPRVARYTRPRSRRRPLRPGAVAIARAQRAGGQPGASPPLGRQPRGHRRARPRPPRPRRGALRDGRHPRAPGGRRHRRAPGHRAHQRPPAPGRAWSRRSIRPSTRGSSPGATARSSWRSSPSRRSGSSTSSWSTCSPSPRRSASGASRSTRRSR